MSKNKEIDYGILSDVSRNANCNILGDCEGSTISRRTTRGFKKAFNLQDADISDQNAEHIVHLAMVGTAACVTSKKDDDKIGGLLLLASLAYFYQKGK